MFYKILPENLKADAQIAALAKSLSAELAKILTDAQLTLHLPRLDSLPDNVLDHLAYQYHADFYSDDFSLDIKRNLIRETFFKHRIKGTAAAVEKILSAVMVNPVVEEYFEYSGAPYYFRIKTGGFLLELDNESRFLELINDAKNLRSWLEEITFDLTIEEPETLNVAHLLNDAEFTVTDIASPEGEEIVEVQAIIEKASTLEVTDIAEENSICAERFVALVEMAADFEVTEADYYQAVDDDFARLCRERWRRFKDNPVIEHYHHHDHDWDGELEPGEEEIFPSEDFLRLYFDFPGGNVRYLTLLNPRDDLKAAEINSFGNYTAQNEILLNRAGYFAEGIKRALLITRSVENVL